ncbi:putative ZDHHC-type palmitoyltransferase 5 [Hungatella hathewayi CAG:224]|nr:putative ZDHHC-type palmitoyltransferase 5 [Hungatella hathewayi CAG:224]
MRMRENAFAFRRFREYEQICSCWQGFKEMRMQEIVLLQAAAEKEVMITKQESKNLSYEDYQDFFVRRKVLSK